MIEEQIIQNWLIDEGFLKEKIVDENANFHYVINYPENNIMDVIQPKGKDGVVLVGCATQVADQHLTLMRQSSEKTKEDFVWNVRFALNKYLVDFDLNVENNELRQFVITDEIYDDGLSKHNFIKTIKKVFKAKLECVWLIEQVFGEIDPSKANPSNENNMFV